VEVGETAGEAVAVASVAASTTTQPTGIASTRPKRGSAASTTATSGQDVNSFFQNLLAKK